MVTLRLKKFLEDKRIFTEQQNGFRSGRCTTDSICKLEFDVRNGFIKGHSTLAVFLDITQAFDSVSHNILLKKLADLGAGLAWFKPIGLNQLKKPTKVWFFRFFCFFQQNLHLNLVNKPKYCCVLQ